MLRWLRSFIGAEVPRGPTEALETIDRDVAASLLKRVHGLPHIDWNLAGPWLDRQAGVTDRHSILERALVAGWLDEMRDAIEQDCQRWRHPLFEGLAPMEHGVAQRVARGADHAADVVAKALRSIRGNQPFPPLAVVCLPNIDTYYSFVSPFYPDQGEFATSGGMYLRSERPSFPTICLVASDKHALEATLAHELTHHALSPLGMPLWLEEGFTQMMEERVIGATGFTVNCEILARHRALWGEVGLDRFFSGEAFHSPEGEQQELAYHLSQLIVRSELSENATRFFEFSRAASEGDAGDAAAREHLRRSLFDLVPFKAAEGTGDG